MPQGPAGPTGVAGQAAPFQQSVQALQGSAQGQGQGGPSPVAALIAATQRRGPHLRGRGGARGPAGGTNQGLAQGIESAGSSIGQALRMKYQREWEEEHAKKQQEYALEQQTHLSELQRRERGEMQVMMSKEKYADHLLTRSQVMMEKVEDRLGILSQAIRGGSTELPPGYGDIEWLLFADKDTQDTAMAHMVEFGETEPLRHEGIWEAWLDGVVAEAHDTEDAQALRDEMHEDRESEMSLVESQSLIHKRHLAPAESAFGTISTVLGVLSLEGMFLYEMKNMTDKGQQLRRLKETEQQMRHLEDFNRSKEFGFATILGAVIKDIPAVIDRNTGIEIEPAREERSFDDLRTAWLADYIADQETYDDRVQMPGRGPSIFRRGELEPSDELQEAADKDLVARLFGTFGEKTVRAVLDDLEAKIEVEPAIAGAYGAHTYEVKLFLNTILAGVTAGGEAAGIATKLHMDTKDLSEEAITSIKARNARLITLTEKLERAFSREGGLNFSMNQYAVALRISISNSSNLHMADGVPPFEAYQHAVETVLHEAGPFLPMTGKEFEEALKQLAGAYGIDEDHEEHTELEGLEEDEEIPQALEAPAQQPVPQPQQPVQPQQPERFAPAKQNPNMSPTRWSP